MSDRATTGPSGEEKPLRQRVNELEATVEGLTQELVETAERLKELEAALEDGPAEDAEPADDVNTGGDEGTEDDAESGDDEPVEEQDDIIIA